MHNDSLLGPYAKPKRDWRATLFDRLNPGAGDMGEEDKERLGRAGLMQLASGLLSTGGGFGNALAAGLSGGQKAMSQGVDDMATQQYKRMIAAQQSAAPGEFRSADLMARAAGYEPGTDGYKDFMKRKNGEIGRASSAGYSFDTIDWGGTPVQTRRNGATGAQDIWSGDTWIPMDGAPPPGTQPPASVDAEFNAFAQQASADTASRGEPPLQPQELLTIFRQMKSGQPVNSSQSLLGNAGQPQPQAPTPNQGPLAGALPPAAPPSESLLGPAAPPAINPRGMGVGRSAEDEAAAKQAAMEAVTLGNLPLRGRLEADNAGLTEAAKRRAELDAYVKATAPTVDRAAQTAQAEAAARAQSDRDAAQAKKRISGLDTLGLMDEAETLVAQSTGSGLGAAADSSAAFFGKSTEGANAIASLRTIAGQLVAKMPRMEGPQSDKDVQMYKDMAGDIANPSVPREQRLAAMRTIRALNAKYAGQPPAAPDRPAGKSIKRTGLSRGRKVVEYTDGSIEYAD